MGDAANSAAKNAGQSVLSSISSALNDAVNWTIQNLTTAWLKIPSPNLEGSNNVLTWMTDHLYFFTLAGAFASILVGSYRLATTQKWEHARDLVNSLVKLVLVSSLSGAFISAGLAAGDAFVPWILDTAHLDFSKTIALSAIQNPVIVMLLAGIVVLIQIIQFFVMMIRNSMIVWLAAMLPTMASASNTRMGDAALTKAMAWTIAFVLYRPTAALIYAASFRMASNDQGIATQVSGVGMMLLALIALPALMKFLVPAVSAASGVNSGAIAVGAVGAAVGTGAVLATGGVGAGFGAGAAAKGSGAVPTTPPTSPPRSTPGPTGTGGDSGSGGDGPTGSPGSRGSDGAGGLTGGDGAQAPPSTGARDTVAPAQEGPSGSGGGGRHIPWRDVAGGAGAGARGADKLRRSGEDIAGEEIA